MTTAVSNQHLRRRALVAVVTTAAAAAAVVGALTGTSASSTAGTPRAFVASSSAPVVKGPATIASTSTPVQSSGTPNTSSTPSAATPSVAPAISSPTAAATVADPAWTAVAPVDAPGFLQPWSNPSVLPADVLIADKRNNRRIVIDPPGRLVWQFPRPGDLAAGQTFLIPDDAFFSADGKYIVATEE